MFGGILTKVLGGALIVSLLAGGITSGVLYVKNVRLENKVLQETARANNEKLRANAAEENLKVAEQTINLFRKMEKAYEAIENAPNDAVAGFLRTGVWPKQYPPPPAGGGKGDGIPPPSSSPEAGKPGEGQKR